MFIKDRTCLHNQICQVYIYLRKCLDIFQYDGVTFRIVIMAMLA